MPPNQTLAYENEDVELVPTYEKKGEQTAETQNLNSVSFYPSTLPHAFSVLSTRVMHRLSYDTLVLDQWQTRSGSRCVASTTQPNFVELFARHERVDRFQTGLC